MKNEVTERVYLAGPMTGIPEFNYPAFNRVASRLRADGLHVENPAENPDPDCGTWAGYMRKALAQLVTCDRIHLMPGWQHSRGAGCEKQVAEWLGLTISFEPEAPLVAPVAHHRV